MVDVKSNINIDHEVENIVNRYAELLSNEIDITEMYLFGSYVSGNFTDDSDIDLAVVSDSFIGDPIDDLLKLMKIRRRVNYKIEPHPFTTIEFNISNPYAREVIQSGIKVR